MKLLKRILIGLLVIFILASGGFVLWAQNASQPTEIALGALESDSSVNVSQQDDMIIFTPVSGAPSTGFIFYPGGRVDYRAYAPIMHRISEQGYLVVLLKVKLNLAFFDINAADKTFVKFPSIQHWALGGHSLGGVAAAIYTSSHLEQINGVVFFASYPADDKLKNSNIKILSLYGTNDGLTTGDKIDASKALLPTDAQFIPIEGGNHAQFGSYGLQSGDNPATISAEEQWRQAADAVVKFLASLAQ